MAESKEQDAISLIMTLEEVHPDAVHLARAVSLAVRVEPELLRKIRLEIFPGMEAGAEADLWFSPLVDAQSPLTMVLFPEVQEILREQLAMNKDLLDRSRQIIQEIHCNAPPAIRLEEEIISLSLSGR